MTVRKKGNWSTQELERLRVLYTRSSAERVARLLHRSVESVRRRAAQMFRRRPKRGPWTEEEDMRLRLAYGVVAIAELALVVGRPAGDVRARLAGMQGSKKRGPWTRREEILLKKLYGSRSDEDLEVCLSRSRAQIAGAAARLCLSKDKGFTARNGHPMATSVRQRMPRWSTVEIARLCDVYPHHDNLEVARRLGRTVASVANKASQIGLKKSVAVLEAMGRRNVEGRYQR